MSNLYGVRPAKTSPMKWRKLQARKALLGLTNAQLAEAAGVCEKTVSVWLNGDDAVSPEIQDALAQALGLRRVIDFEPVEADRDFDQIIAV
jgi:transcriptional regulator with XRE-family HTH domain